MYNSCKTGGCPGCPLLNFYTRCSTSWGLFLIYNHRPVPQRNDSCGNPLNTFRLIPMPTNPESDSSYGIGNISYCICDIEIIKNLVIATEMPENEGTSVTNMAEYLATQVCQEFGINPKHLIWIEHYPQRREWAEYPKIYREFQPQ